MPRPRGPLHTVLMTRLPTETRREEEQDGTQGNFYNPPLDFCHVLVIRRESQSPAHTFKREN